MAQWHTHNVHQMRLTPSHARILNHFTTWKCCIDFNCILFNGNNERLIWRWFDDKWINGASEHRPGVAWLHQSACIWNHFLAVCTFEFYLMSIMLENSFTILINWNIKLNFCRTCAFIATKWNAHTHTHTHAKVIEQPNIKNWAQLMPMNGH